MGLSRILLRRPFTQHAAVASKLTQKSTRQQWYAKCAQLVVVATIVAVAAQVRSNYDVVGSAIELHEEGSKPPAENNVLTTTYHNKHNERCAINFFGLPRAFASLVLPSIVKNIIKTNQECDYYIHYYYKTEEAAGRSGQGGVIDPIAILTIKDAIFEVVRSRGEPYPRVEFVYDTDYSFSMQYKELLEKIRHTTVAETGKYLYFPWKAHTYLHPVTTDNIVKMWHSIQSVWQLMERTASSRKIHYPTVAMLRVDAVYVTPIDIRDATNSFVKIDAAAAGANNNNNNKPPVTIPSFGKHPVSDRIIYGPTEAVKIWATERFSRLENHVHYVQQHKPGWGMHSERFLNTTIFPSIQNITNIRQHPTLCFLRARADETVWISDCEGPASVAAPSIRKALGKDMRLVVEQTIGRKCPGEIKSLTKTVKSLDCFKSS